MHCPAQEVIVLNDSETSYNIGRQTSFLRDPKGDLTIDSVAIGSASRQFKQSNSSETNFGHTSDAVWVEFALRNGATTGFEWLLAENYSVVDEVELYSPSSGGKFREMVSGIDYPMSERAIQTRVIAFPLILKPSEGRVYYLRFKSQLSLPVSLTIWKPSAFFRNNEKENLILGIFYGALTIMAFYNLFLFLSVKDFSYLYYSLYALITGYYQSCMDGLRFRFILPNSIGLANLEIGSSIWLMGIFWTLFGREFLQVEEYSVFLQNLYRIMVGIFLAGVAFTLIFQSGFMYWLSTPLWVFGALPLNIGAAIYCLRRDNPNARIFLVAATIFIVGILLRGLRVSGLVPASWLTESALQIGVITEMTLLSFALGNRINRIRQETEREKALVRSRIAGDLHDEIGSNLSSISVASQMVEQSGNLGELERRQLRGITETARETADSIRDIIWFINPEHDKSEDLVQRMRDTAAKLLQGMRVDFEAKESKTINAKDLQFRRNLYLIFKEALNNIVKHSKAHQVRIEMEESSDGIRLQITDDGVGFDERKIDPRHGDGIKNLKRRAAEIGCDLHISSEPGKGATVTVMTRAE